MSQNRPSTNLTPKQLEDLRQRATAAAHHAYAPYSHFRVGAALLLEDGNITTGCNVENASYRLTTCAEQTAIASAVGQHGPAIRIRAIVVVNLNNTASQPCGACRQTIQEFSTPKTEVFYPAKSGTLAHTTMRDLLPSAFRLTSQSKTSHDKKKEGICHACSYVWRPRGLQLGRCPKCGERTLIDWIATTNK